jgi:hypothetical protein
LTTITVTTEGRLNLSNPLVAEADFALQSAVMFGATASSTSSISQQLGFKCPSGDCDFAPYLSLGVCSRCENITPRLEQNTRSDGTQFFNLIRDQSLATRTPNSTEYRLPNGLFLNNQQGEDDTLVYLTMSGTANSSRTVAMGDIDTLLWSQTLIRLKGTPGSEPRKKWPEADVEAFECGLYYCVQNYTSQVRNTSLAETPRVVENIKRNPTSWQMSNPDLYKGISKQVVDSLAFHPNESSIPRTDLQLRGDGGGNAWNISQTAVSGVNAFFQRSFSACLRRQRICPPGTINDDPTSPNGFLVWGGKDVEYEPALARTLHETQDLSKMFANIATAMSNAIRDRADNATTAGGAVRSSLTVYSVKWLWIVPHAATLLGGLIFVFTTISSSWQARDQVSVWKSSELATLSRGAALGDMLASTKSLKEMEDRAKGTSVYLLDGYRYVRGPTEHDIPLVTTSERSLIKR